MVTNRSNAARLEALAASFGVVTTRDHAALLQDAEMVLLAVRPGQVVETLQQDGPSLHAGHLLISLAAAPDCETIAALLPKEVTVVRAMPNLAAAVGHSVTGLYSQQGMIGVVQSLFEPLGTTVWLDDEAALTPFTALFGSGPGYLYHFVDLLEEGGVALGLDRDQVARFVAEMAFGALTYLKESGATPAELRDEVATPGGVTAAGIAALDAADLRASLLTCLRAAVARAEQTQAHARADLFASFAHQSLDNAGQLP